ncbi:MAG: type II toxin-antitoxin system VapC family toxin [Arcicella sp.]|jgi:PIN domain nuclease of toxin-antitoxin system|nr:type II toxin-antitoxin system VapC family toxin [Arcicella sp.]
MNYILDTQIFIFLNEDNPVLPTIVKEFVANEEVKLYISEATLMEMAILANNQYIETYPSFDKYITNKLFSNEIRVLGLDLLDYRVLSKLPQHHRDPHDRLIIAQAISHGFTVISTDHYFPPYQVDGLKLLSVAKKKY